MFELFLYTRLNGQGVGRIRLKVKDLQGNYWEGVASDITNNQLSKKSLNMSLLGAPCGGSGSGKRRGRRGRGGSSMAKCALEGQSNLRQGSPEIR